MLMSSITIINSDTSVDDDSPQVIVLEDGLIIKEASLVNGQPIGVWAFFEKDEAKYFLKGIFDFR